MKEISINESIDAREMTYSPEKAEETINDKIRTTLIHKMIDALDNMAFIDMEYDKDSDTFDINARVVLCTTQEVGTTAELQAQKLAQYGLDEEQILDILSIGIETDMNGF